MTEQPLGVPERTVWLGRVAAVLIAAGFATWMIKPVGDLGLAFVAYGLVVLGSVANGIRIGFRADPRLVGLAVATVAVGVAGAAWGLLERNPGAASETVFFVGIPLVWLLILFGTDLRAVRLVVELIPFVSFAIGMFGVLYWLFASGIVPGLDWVMLVPLGQGIGVNEFGYELTYYPISSLVFLAPFLLASLFIPSTYRWLASRIMAWPAMAAVLLLIFVSGRRALLISFLLAIVIGFVVLFLGPASRAVRRRIYLVGGVTAAVGVVIVIVSRFSLVDMVASVFAETFSSTSIRGELTQGLIQSWLQSPLIGHGLGATVEGLVRDVERPWNFEVQYLLLLNAVGLIGTVILALAALGLVVLGVVTYKRDRDRAALLAPTLIGTFAVLIANATNPYLHTPGHYWMIFLVTIATNAFIRDRRVADGVPE